ncbi:MAG: glutamine--fructose-6-phosphate transaminase (isomerizing) [Candidatus Omnitrophica bacterium]|nr:glutamine--fructose-6-phosphate transaminase (isomerizing) [Candidatus Omnitrophota bacterium]
MCGIVGYIGPKKALPILMNSLGRLEYRGYDSSGIAVLANGVPESVLTVVKEKGKLSRLRDKLQRQELNGFAGIGHTRWATHGEPSERNAHPHLDCTRKIALVHNGIIENYAELKSRLSAKGHRFQSDTDTEVAVHLVEHHCAEGLKSGKKDGVLGAFQKAVSEMEGFFAFVLLSVYEPGAIYVFKRSNPLVIGIGDGENFVASDAPAVLSYTNRMIYLDDNEFARVTAKAVEVRRADTLALVRKAVTRISWTISQAEKAGFPHFMLKEIHEQPQVVETILKEKLRAGKIWFDSIDQRVESRLKKIEKIHLVSCGTAYHAGLVANYMIGECARLPVEATVSSEFRYEDPIVGPKDLVILITQSGETADTLAALREAKLKGAFTLGIVNVVGSTIARESDCVIYTHAGPEIGVASTKAYLAQLLTLALFSIYIGKVRGQLSPGQMREYIRWLQKLPGQVRETLAQQSRIKQCARLLFEKKNFLYLGRGFNFPTALEGALKLKEITYSHAHGYPAGEMKHGPIALIDSNQPVICLSPASKTYDKMVSNIQEIRARQGIIVSVATRGDAEMEKISRATFFIPRTLEIFSPILTVIPLQLFAYFVAVLNKRDVDQPRNLAKSVTVE